MISLLKSTISTNLGHRPLVESQAVADAERGVAPPDKDFSVAETNEILWQPMCMRSFCLHPRLCK